MHQKILDQLAGRLFRVRILAGGTVLATPADLANDALSHAVCAEIKTALEDALQGDMIGGYCADEETGALEPVAGYALRREGLS